MAGMHSVAELTVLVNTKVGKMLGKDLLAADLKSVSGMYQKASVEAAKLAQTRQRDMEKAERDMAKAERNRELVHQRKAESFDKLVKLETDAGRRIAKIEQQRDAQLAANAEKQMRSAENVSRYQLRQMTQGKRLSSEQALALQQRIAREERDYKKLEADKVRISTNSAEEIARIRIAKDNEVTRVQERNLATLAEAQKKLSAAQLAAGSARTAASIATSQANLAGAKANLASYLGPAGRVAMRGLGGSVLLGAGMAYEGAKWQQSLSQMQAQTPLTDREREMVGRYALNQGAATGINPHDVLDSFRYASDKLGAEAVRSGLARRTVNVAMQTALPAGVPTGDVTSALTTAMVAFPEYRNRPRAVANMLLTASRAGRMDFSQMVENMPMVMAMASSMGVPLSQAGAMFAQGTRSMTPARFQTQEYDLMQHIANPSPKSQKLLDQLAKRGVDLRWDFSYQGQKKIGTMGVINDMRRAGLSNDIIMRLVPNLRGSFGAMLLTGSDQNRQMMSIWRNMLRSQTTNPVGQSFTRYMGLTTTQISRFERSLQQLAIEIGSTLQPTMKRWFASLNDWVHGATNWIHHHRELVRSIADLIPKLALLLAGIKALQFANQAKTWLTGLYSAIVKLGAAQKAATATDALATATTGLGGASTEAMGDERKGVKGVTGSLKTFAAGLGALSLKLLPFIGGIIFAMEAIKHTADPHKTAGGFDWKDAVMALGFPLGFLLRKRTSETNLGRVAKAPSGWRPKDPGRAFGLAGVQLGQNPYTPYALSASQDSLFLGNNPAGMTGWRWTASGQGHPAFHYDLDKPNAAWHLPGGKGVQYRVVGIEKNPLGELQPGWVATFQGPGGALITEMEASQIPKGMHFGSILHGGQYAGRAGPTHIHIGGNQGALDLLYSLATGKHGGGRGGSGNLKLPHVMSPYGGLFTGAGGQYHIDPSVLAAMGMSESSGALASGAHSPEGFGVMGMPMMRTSFTQGRTLVPNQPHAQTYAAAQWLRTQDINWLQKHPAFMNQFAPDLRQMGIYNTHSNQAYLAIGLAMYNAGTGPRNIRGPGLTYARQALGFAKGYNRGHAPALYYRAPSGRSGYGQGPNTESGLNHPPSSDPLLADWPPTDPAGWAQWYSSVASGTLDAIHDRWGAHPNPKNMTAAGRRSYYKQVNDYIRWTFGQRIATYRSQPWLPDQKKSIAAAMRGRKYYLAHQQAFMTLGQQDTGGPPTTPAEWEKYYSGQESKLATWFTNRWGADPDPAKMNAADRKTYHVQARQLARWFFQERIADYRAHPHLPGAAAGLATAQDQLKFFSAHPDRFVNKYVLNRGAVNAAAVRYAHLASRESHLASVIRSGWSGTDPSRMPEWGGGGINQHAWLKAQFKANQLEREARDNHWRQMRALHQISKNTLKTYLEIDKQALNRRNREARQRAFFGTGASGSVVPVHVIGRCAAEEANRKHHAKTASGTHEVVKNTAKTNSLLDNIRRDWHRNHKADQKYKKSMHRKVIRGGSAGGMHYTIIEQLPGA